MLDKSIPYKEITMRLPAEKLILLDEPILPEGYAFRLYQPGD